MKAVLFPPTGAAWGAVLACIVAVAGGCSPSETTSAASNTGATSGTGATAGGGTGGTGANTSTGECSGDCKACRTCALGGQCKDELEACSGVPDCVDIDACVFGCEPVTAACVSACAAGHSLGVPAYNALAACLFCDACEGSCGGCNALGCIDDAKSGTETDVDCGGAECAPCGLGKACLVSADCGSGQCVDGVCCEVACNGPCEACTTAKTGEADGLCKFIAMNGDPDDECAGADACSGAGECLCGDGDPNGAETDTDCGGPVCGACAQGAKCMAATDCQSGACTDGVCCDDQCKDTCEACSAAKKGAGPDGVCGPIVAGTDPDSECGSPATDVCNGNGMCQCFDGVQNGGETTVDCGGPFCAAAGSTCNNGTQDCGESDSDCGGLFCTKCALGKKCVVDGDCTSGACADGVCCTSKCTGTCQACKLSLTGQPDGTCAAIPDGVDPENECVDQGSMSCGTDGMCGGKGGCRFYGQGTDCGDDLSCMGTTQTNPDVCNGAGLCQDGGVTSCGLYVCGPSSCKVSCAGDADCSSGNYCTAQSTCAPKKANGQVCSATNQCLSGFCTDGVCCNTLCNGTCMACGTGTCTPVANNTDPANECATQAQSTCGTTGVCNGAGACALYANGTPCNTTCAASVQTNYTCNGAGSCLSTSTTSCGYYVCNGAVCGSTCASDAQCIPAGYCNVVSCAADKPNGQGCSSASQCQSGNCVGGVCCDEPSCGANATCGGGSCNCNGNYLNCDGGWGNGCEINGNSDNNNCGGCGSTCLGARYECCGAVCHDLCNPNECGACFGCPGAQCYANQCNNACP